MNIFRRWMERRSLRRMAGARARAIAQARGLARDLGYDLSDFSDDDLADAMIRSCRAAGSFGVSSREATQAFRELGRIAAGN